MLVFDDEETWFLNIYQSGKGNKFLLITKYNRHKIKLPFAFTFVSNVPSGEMDYATPYTSPASTNIYSFVDT